MVTSFEKRLIFVWLALSAITIAQLGVGWSGDGAALTPSTAVAAGAVAIALVKVRLILREFMEVRHAPTRLGRLTDLWLGLTTVALLAAYAAGSASGS